ncbi:MAG TPA: hypothetical protein ENH29_01645, partial [Bacteroidetes bacterium]|nr:hypothetical protein [Bacteroidota bacterium]
MDTKNDLDQPNESYYLAVQYPDGTWAFPCDPNLGSWKVVPDTLVSDTTGLRYAGTFYFKSGVNQITLNHYAIIVKDYPDLWIGPSDSASIINGSPNSVHVSQIVMEKVAADGYDLAVTYSAKTDASLPINGNVEQVVPAGKTYSYQIDVEGLGTQTKNDIKLWMIPPDSTRLSNYNIPPDGADSDTLYWNFYEVNPGQKISITYDAEVASVLPVTPFLLFSECAIESGCENNTNNNTAETTVYAINLPDYFGTDINLTQNVQTDTSLQINGNLAPVVPAGKYFTVEIQVENKGPKTSSEVMLWLVQPDSVKLVNFNIPPDNSSGDTLFWRFDSLTPGQLIDITFQAGVTDTVPYTPFPLPLISRVNYPYDTDTGNNAAQDTVYVIDPFTIWGTDISLTQTIRTDSTMEIGGNKEQVVPVGGRFNYALHVRNQGPNPAQDVIVWIISPDTVQLHNFNIPPSRISGDTLFWVFDNLSLGQQVDITFQADVSHNLYNVPYRLPVISGLDYIYDTNASNDSADDTVYVVDTGYFATTVCDTINAGPDTTRISRDPNQTVVIADVIERRSRCAVQVRADEPGYYQIMVNTWNDAN